MRQATRTTVPQATMVGHVVRFLLLKPFILSLTPLCRYVKQIRKENLNGNCRRIIGSVSSSTNNFRHIKRAFGVVEHLSTPSCVGVERYLTTLDALLDVSGVTIIIDAVIFSSREVLSLDIGSLDCVMLRREIQKFL